MNKFQQQNSLKKTKSEFGMRGFPANKRPRVSSSPGRQSSKNTGIHPESDDEDDPFAEDMVTGEELEQWERLATQAEISLTQEQSAETSTHRSDSLNNMHQINGDFKFKIPPENKVTNGAGSKREYLHDGSLIKELQKNLKLYENKVKEMEASYTRKDGETRILRDRLNRTEKDLNAEKVKIVEIQKKHAEVDRERTKYVEKQVEKYKDQMEFKQAEIMESQNVIRNLEAKNKQMLVNQENGSISCNKTNFSDGRWPNTQEFSNAAKKIKLIKPESPRVQATVAATFNDDPLGRKKPVKFHSRPSSSTSTPSTVINEISSEQMPEEPAKKFQMKSKYINNDIWRAAKFQDLITSNSLDATMDCKNDKSPLFCLLNDETRKSQTEAMCAMNGVKNLLSTPKHDFKLFKYLTRCDSGDNEGSNELLPLINKALSCFILMQENWVENQSPGHEITVSNGKIQHTKQTFPCETCMICERACAAVQVLRVLTVYSSQIVDFITSRSSSDTLKHVIKLCSCDRLDSRISHNQDITINALHVISTLANGCKTYLQFNLFASFAKGREVLLPLVKSNNVNVKCSTFDVLTALVRYQPFALVVVKEDEETDSASVLSHICDICCADRSQECDEMEWIDLQTKIINFLSVLVSQHEALLFEHSCYSEIHHAGDVVLYNQLLQSKKDVEIVQSRTCLIHRSVCLLHSCSNVYSDGIPGSRREHRHAVVLVELERFLSRYCDENSFWSQELNRIAKAEVKSLFEEVETT